MRLKIIGHDPVAGFRNPRHLIELAERMHPDCHPFNAFDLLTNFPKFRQEILNLLFNFKNIHGGRRAELHLTARLQGDKGIMALQRNDIPAFKHRLITKLLHQLFENRMNTSFPVIGEGFPSGFIDAKKLNFNPDPMSRFGFGKAIEIVRQILLRAD